MTLMLPDIPRDLNQALRRRAEAEGKTVDQVAVEAIRAGLGLPSKKRDLSDFAGTWSEDPAFDEVRKFHEQIDPEMWR